MRKDKNERTAEQLFRSRLFRRLFASYVILILVFLIGASGWYLVSYSRNERESRLAGARQSGHALATEADRTMLTAKALCSAVDTSESFRNLYQTIMIEKTAPDSMQLYRTLGERFRQLDAWSLSLITAFEDAERCIGRKADKNRKIYNGMMKTYFYQFLGKKPPKRRETEQK